MNIKLPARWIGRGGPLIWPARYPDLATNDFFSWGYLKSIVYAEPVSDINELKRRIENASATITPDMISNVIHGFKIDCDIVMVKMGKYSNI